MSNLRKPTTRGTVIMYLVSTAATVQLLDEIRFGVARFPIANFVVAVVAFYYVVRFVQSFPTQRQLDQRYIDALTKTIKEYRAKERGPS